MNLCKVVCFTVLLLVAVTQAKKDRKCRRTDSAMRKKQSAEGSRYVKVVCKGKDLTTLNSDFLYETVIGPPPRTQDSSLTSGGIVHDAPMEITPIYHVTLENSHIKNVQDGAFNAVPTLEVLNLKSNELSEIKRRTFEGLKLLKDLKLDRNQISSIEPSSFGQMRKLKYVTFSENLLQELNYFTFQGLKESNHLNIEYNNISILNAGSFAAMPQLENLYLSYNKISRLDGGILAGLRNLKYLFLSGNNIETILNGAFKGNPKLEMLDLSNNLLTEITVKTFEGLLYIKRLSLRNNDLSYIEDGAFQGMPLLNELDLSHNALTTISRGWFWGLINLQYFQIVSNEIEETAMLPKEDDKFQSLVGALRMLCRMRGLHFADLKGNGIYDMIQRLEIEETGFDLKDSDKHSCIF
uniref:insulin-like growth factor-binding protein complex acid labile subunit n=1 Tax=Styela clava TaxID=7725 RepID=UPI00193AC3BE|nr:insulin-like growth factor-binding protein complex acid labile subunit [Styela clava]